MRRGTYFECLDRVLHADRGHFVAFSGALTHAGAPIRRGRRYVLVLFCYLEGWSSSGPLGDDDPAAYKWLQKSDQPTKPAGGKATPAAEGEDGDGESDGWLLPGLKAAASSSFPIGTRVELHSLNGKPQLNGRVGEVISKPYAKGGRVDVRLDDGSGYNFSTSNLLRR